MKHTKHKKILISVIAALLALVLIVGIAAAVIVTPFLQHRGKLGDDVYYLHNEKTGTVIVYGEGGTSVFDPWAMPDFEPAEISPFNFDHRAYSNEYYDSNGELVQGDPPAVKKVIILDGVTRVFGYTFVNCSDLEEIYIPASMVDVDSFAFCSCPGIQRVYFGGDAPKETDFEGAFCLNHPDAPEMEQYPTVIHKPGTGGFSGYSWREAEHIEEQNFHMNWFLAFWPW